MSCDKYQDMIPLFALGELDDTQKAEVKRHLTDCTMCREQLEEISQVVKALSSSELDSLTDIEKLKMENEIYKRLASGADKKQLTGTQQSLSKLLLRVAAVIVIFTFGFGARHFLKFEQEPSKFLTAESMLAKKEFNWSDAPGMRFSAKGFKLIAKGKAALKNN